MLGGAGGADALFQPVIEDIRQTLAGRPLDLYVMTHEHLDHVQGLPYAARKLGITLPVDYAWLTASAAPDYYDAHPEARKKRLALQNEYAAIREYLAAAPERATPLVQALLANNNPRDTEDCISYLRTLATKTTLCLSRLRPDGHASLPGGQARHLGAGGGHRRLLLHAAPDRLWLCNPQAAAPAHVATTPLPPAGVDAGAFYNLVEFRRSGFSDNLLAIDRAANNTSVVLALEWRGWRLLFPGDAEQLSWLTMDRQRHAAAGPLSQGRPSRQF